MKDLEEELAQTETMKATTINSEGSVTRSKEKASSEESTDNSTEEQEPLSRKGRNSNKIIREQEVVREKAEGKQSNLDFLVKNSQARKYLLSAEEEKRRKKRHFNILRNNEAGLLELQRIRRFPENRSNQKVQINGVDFNPSYLGDKKVTRR